MAEARDDTPWLAFEGERRTHAEIEALADRAASGLRALGCAEGDTVALLLANGFVLVEAQAGAARAGCFPVPLNPAAEAETAGFILRDCAARLLIAERAALDRIRQEMPPDLTVILAEDWDGWVAGHPRLAVPAAAARGAIIYTSGTTGRPKGVRRAPSPPGARPVRALRVYGFDRPERATALVDGPLWHSVPNAYLRVAMGAGANVVLRRRFDPDATLAAIASDRVSHLHLVPAAMTRLLALPAGVRRSADVRSLRHVVHGAAPCAAPLKRALIDWWGPVVHEYYGSSETGLVAFHGAAEAAARPGTVGRALPGITIRILDAAGRDVPPGGIGRVYAGSETLHAFTYIGAPERRAAVGHGDLVTAGDLGWLDAQGYLFLAGREAEAIHVGAVTVHPALVEARLAAEPGVADCAVIGTPGPGGAPIVTACVEPLTDVTVDRERLAAVLAEVLPAAARPGSLRVVGRLPREPSGKLSKRKLLRSAAEIAEARGVSAGR